MADFKPLQVQLVHEVSGGHLLTPVGVHGCIEKEGKTFFPCHKENWQTQQLLLGPRATKEKLLTRTDIILQMQNKRKDAWWRHMAGGAEADEALQPLHIDSDDIQAGSNRDQSHAARKRQKAREATIPDVCLITMPKVGAADEITLSVLSGKGHSKMYVELSVPALQYLHAAAIHQIDSDSVPSSAGGSSSAAHEEPPSAEERKGIHWVKGIQRYRVPWRSPDGKLHHKHFKHEELAEAQKFAAALDKDGIVAE